MQKKDTKNSKILQNFTCALPSKPVKVTKHLLLIIAKYINSRGFRLFHQRCQDKSGDGSRAVFPEIWKGMVLLAVRAMALLSLDYFRERQSTESRNLRLFFFLSVNLKCVYS
jgi:hypothetical protein